MSTLLDKYTLKEKVIKIDNELDKMVGELMSPGCADNETGKLRSQVYSRISDLHSKLKEIIYNIY